MYKKISLFLAIFVLSSSVLSVPVSAQSGYASENLPETNGVYNVPGHPELKLHVFVHQGKDTQAAHANQNGKPQPQPTLVCAPTGTADPDSSAVDGLAGWNLPANWTYHLNVQSVPATVGASNFSTIASNGYGQWLGAIHNAVSITRGTDTTATKATLDGQNIITWGRASGSALAVTYTWYDKTTGVATEIDTIMNQNFTWYWSNPTTWDPGQTCAYTNVYDAQNILTHELGHTMGLDDEYSSDYTNNTMYGYGATGQTKKDTLTGGDSAAVSSLY